MLGLVETLAGNEWKHPARMVLKDRAGSRKYKQKSHSWKKYIYICSYIYMWITLLYTRNEHNIVKQVYFNKRKIIPSIMTCRIPSSTKIT